MLTLQVLKEAHEHLTVVKIHEHLERYEPRVNLSTVF